MTLNNTIDQLRLQLLEKGFNSEVVPREDRNGIFDLKFSEGYVECRVMYEGFAVCFLEIWEIDRDTLQVLLHKMLPAFDRVEGTEDIVNIVAEYNGATIK